MRSLIIIEVEHGDTTDELEALAQNLAVEINESDGFENLTLIDYTVRVDVPACFVLDSGNTDNRE